MDVLYSYVVDYLVLLDYEVDDSIEGEDEDEYEDEYCCDECGDEESEEDEEDEEDDYIEVFEDIFWFLILWLKFILGEFGIWDFELEKLLNEFCNEVEEELFDVEGFIILREYCVFSLVDMFVWIDESLLWNLFENLLIFIDKMECYVFKRLVV